MFESQNDHSSSDNNSNAESPNMADYEIKNEEPINQESEELSGQDENLSTEQDSMDDFDDGGDDAPPDDS